MTTALRGTELRELRDAAERYKAAIGIRKGELAEAIRLAIQDFEAETSAVVTSVDVNRTVVAKLGEHRDPPPSVLTTIHVETE